MRYALLLLLVLPAAVALDSSRETTHVIQPDLTDIVEYVDTFYGTTATETYDAVSQGNAYDFISGRVPRMRIDNYSMDFQNGIFTVRIAGMIDDFVTRSGRNMKLGGRGFIDGICELPRLGAMPAVNQSFAVRIYLPKNLTVVSVPENKSADLGHISYELLTWHSGGVAYQNLTMAVLAAELSDYCAEREIIDAQLKYGIIAGPVEPGVPDLLLSAALFALLLAALVRLLRGRLF